MTPEEIEKALIRLDRLVADALDREDEWVDGADTGDVQTALNLARHALALEKSRLVEKAKKYRKHSDHRTVCGGSPEWKPCMECLQFLDAQNAFDDALAAYEEALK